MFSEWKSQNVLFSVCVEFIQQYYVFNIVELLLLLLLLEAHRFAFSEHANPLSLALSLSLLLLEKPENVEFEKWFLWFN